MRTRICQKQWNGQQQNYSDSGPQLFKTVVSFTRVPTSLCFRIYYRYLLYLKDRNLRKDREDTCRTRYNQKLNFLLMAKPVSGSGSAQIALIYLSRSGSALRQTGSWSIQNTSVSDPGPFLTLDPGSGMGKKIRIRDEHPRLILRELRNSF